MNTSRRHDRRDRTIAEIHRTRERISAASGGDIHAIVEEARRRQERSGRRTVSCAGGAAKTIEPGESGVGGK
jgi:fructose-1,6-bisphosphatase/sedoheptulose 1,7-bisphosphatase-like protein